jgi:ferritin
MFGAIQEQITVERTNSAVYYQLAIAMEKANWPGFAKFLRKNAHEETQHANRFIRYLVAQNRYPALGIVQAPVAPAAPAAAFRAALDAENATTVKVKALTQQARKEEDYDTEDALRWFRREQVRSVKEFQQWSAEAARADAAYLKMLDEQLGE